VQAAAPVAAPGSAPAAARAQAEAEAEVLRPAVEAEALPAWARAAATRPERERARA
jgi:hypothetical protein